MALLRSHRRYPQPCTYVTKVAANPLLELNENSYFTIRFANMGTVPLPDVKLTDPFPSGLTFLSSVPAQFSGPNPLVWNLGTVGTNEIRTIIVNFKATSLGTVINGVTATSSTNKLGGATDTVEVSAKALLYCDKEASPSTLSPGGTVTYTLRISNGGTGNNGVPLVITDQLPPNFSYVSLVSASLNGDGVFNGSDVGIPNVTLNLYEDTNGNGAIDAGDLLIATTNSGAGGIYTFPGLGTNFNYIVDADDLDPDLTTFFSPNSYTATTIALRSILSLTGTNNTADFGYANLPSTIGDTVFSDVNLNNVYDFGTDEPLSLITVTLYRDSNGDGIADGPALATTVTDINGQYLFGGLAPDTYLVVVDTDDTDLAAGFGASIREIEVVLAANTNYLTADFPFIQLIDKTVNITFAGLGTNLTYTIKPYWPGPDSLIDAQVTDPVPTNTVYIANSANAEGTNDNGVVTWNLGSTLPASPADTVGVGFTKCPAPPLTNSAVADTFIRRTSPTNNFGVTDPLSSARDTSTTNKDVILMRFDLSSVPAGATIQGATFYIYNSEDGDKKDSVSVRRLLTPWVEGTKNGTGLADGATWNRQDGTNNWASGAFGTNDYSSKIYATIGVNKSNLLSADVTALVKDWLSTTNNGMALLQEGIDNEVNEWSSRSNSTAANRPKLVIRYEITTNVVCSAFTTNTVSGDAVIDENAPTTAGGTGGDLKVKVDSAKRKYALIKPDLSGIPTGAILTNAFLDMNLTGGLNNNSNLLYRVTTDWTEGGATWNTRDGVTRWANGTNFTTADYDTNLLARWSVDDSLPTVVISTNLTTVISNWVNNVYPNYGFVLIPIGSTTGDVKYDAREKPSVYPRIRATWGTVLFTKPATHVEMDVNPLLFTGTNNVTVTMTVTSGTNINSITAPTNLVVNASGVNVGKVSGPSPAGSVNLSSNAPLIFTWVYAVTNGSDSTVKSVSFSGSPTSPNAEFGNASSRSTIVVPPLTFKVAVTNLIGGTITNAATLADSGAVNIDSPEVATATSANSIGDYVWHDLNGDGIQQGGEPPFTNITVVLYKNSLPVATNLTDVNGLYSFAGLELGTNEYQVLFTNIPSGFAFSPANQGGNTNLDSNPNVLTGLTPVITMNTGETNNSVDAGLVGILNIGGTVWYDASGNGTNDLGEVGITNVPVTLLSITGGTTNVVTSQNTDATGFYNFTNLPPGNYQVVISNPPPAYPFSTVDRTTTDLGAAAPDEVDNGSQPSGSGTEVRSPVIALAAGTEPTADGDGANGNRTLDFGFDSTATVTGHLYYDTNGNGVQEGGEPNLTNVTVTVTSGTNIVLVSTDASGNWSANVPPGSVTNNVDNADADFLAQVPAGYIQTEGTDPTVVTAPAGVTTSAGNDGYYTPATVTGHLYYDVNGNGVQEGGEPNLTNVTVTVTSGTNIVLVSTDASGNWSANVPPGSVTNNVDNADADFLAQVPPGYIQTEGTDPTVVNAPAGVTTPTGNDGYFAPATIGDYAWSDLNGDGIQQGGEPPFTNITVILYLSGIPVATNVTDANGLYVFTNLPPATNQYQVLFTNLPPGFGFSAPNQGSDTNLDSNPNPLTGLTPVITLIPGQTNNSIDAGIRVSLSVGSLVWFDANNDGTNNNAEVGISSVSVYLLSVDTNANTTTVVGTTNTDINGLYHFSNLLPGNYQVVISNPPASYPLASLTIVTNDTGANGPDNLNNGTQSTNGAGSYVNQPVRSPVFNLSLNTEPPAGVDGTDANSNDTVDFGFGVIPTYAQVGTVRAANGWVEFTTSTELGSVGFDVYRQTEEGWVKVSANRLPAVDEPQGGTYRVADVNQPAAGDVTYRIVELDDNGQENVLGPVTVTANSEAVEYTASVVVARAPMATKVQRIAAALQVRNTARALTGAGGYHLVKITVNQSGVQYVSAETIAAAVNRAVSEVQDWLKNGVVGLTHGGRAVTYIPAQDGAGLYFVGEAGKMGRVYWLSGTKNATVESVDGGSPESGPVDTQEVTTAYERDLLPVPQVTSDPTDDFWMWGRIVTEAVVGGKFSTTFQLDATVDGSGEIDVRLQGGSQASHKAQVTLNGTVLGVTGFAGKAVHGATFAVPAGVLHSGNNQLTVTGLKAGNGSRFYLDRFNLKTSKQLMASNGRLEFKGQGVVTLGGFSRPDVVVFELSDVRNPKVVMNLTSHGSTVSLQTTEGVRYLAIQGGGAITPARVEAVTLAGLGSGKRKGEYVVIAPAAMAKTAEELAGYRRSQGLTAVVVTVEDIANEYGDGLISPEAIRGFIEAAHEKWIRGPAYVVLVGDGTYDYRDISRSGDNVIPAGLTGTGYGLYASDSLLGDVDGDGVPEVAVGRLPVLTSIELERMIGKIRSYEAGTAAKVLVVADRADGGGDFGQDGRAMKGILGLRRPTELLSGNPTAVRDELMKQLKGGQVGLLSYIGHGGLDRLGSSDRGYLTSADATGTGLAGSLPVIAAGTCVAGQFSVPGFDCVGEELVVAEGGAVAVWAPSGLSLNPESQKLHRAFARSLGKKGTVRLGDALRAAAREYRAGGGKTEVSGTHNLLGDPALKVK